MSARVERKLFGKIPLPQVWPFNYTTLLGFFQTNEKWKFVKASSWDSQGVKLETCHQYGKPQTDWLEIPNTKRTLLPGEAETIGGRIFVTKITAP